MNGQMEDGTKDNINWIKGMEQGLCITVQLKNIQDVGIMGRNMVKVDMNHKSKKFMECGTEVNYLKF